VYRRKGQASLSKAAMPIAVVSSSSSKSGAAAPVAVGCKTAVSIAKGISVN
jgi:hypothetical protein